MSRRAPEPCLAHVLLSIRCASGFLNLSVLFHILRDSQNPCFLQAGHHPSMMPSLPVDAATYGTLTKRFKAIPYLFWYSAGKLFAGNFDRRLVADQTPAEKQGRIRSYLGLLQCFPHLLQRFGSGDNDNQGRSKPFELGCRDKEPPRSRRPTRIADIKPKDPKPLGQGSQHAVHIEYNG